jgi:hypothetical protein
LNLGAWIRSLGAACGRGASRLASSTVSHLRLVVGLALLAVVPVLIVSTEGQLKQIVERFVGGCVFVIKKDLTPDGTVLVTGHLSGAPPQRLPLTFEGRGGVLINSVEFEAAYRDGSDDNPIDLGFHPFTGRTCPGSLCEITTPNRPVLTIVMTDLRPELSYRFRVRVLPPDGVSKLQNLDLVRTYVIFDAGLPGGTCRVQPPRWFNFWVWASPTIKALTFVVVIVLGGLLLRWANSGKVPS